jgi:hypothetical protein
MAQLLKKTMNGRFLNPIFITLLASVLLSGCATSQPTKSTATTTPTPVYGEIYNFYHPVVGVTGNQSVEPNYIYAGSQEDASTDYANYLQKGYRLLGYSSFSNLDVPQSPFDFNPPAPMPDQIIAQAKRVGADVALYWTVNEGREDINVPLSAGGYIPQSYMRVDRNVQFLAK